jgi:hypothetical protein
VVQLAAPVLTRDLVGAGPAVPSHIGSYTVAQLPTAALLAPVTEYR